MERKVDEKCQAGQTRTNIPKIEGYPVLHPPQADQYLSQTDSFQLLVHDQLHTLQGEDTEHLQMTVHSSSETYSLKY